MRIVIHLSDLHFGRADPVIVHPLLDFIRATKPDLVAVSGDLTQRAHTEQFLEARNLLDAIPFPKIVVPGNHDVPSSQCVRPALSDARQIPSLHLRGPRAVLCRQ